jgi:hypothetical protein
MWTGTADSVVDLNSSTYGYTIAYGVSTSHEVGYGFLSATSIHALLWNGTASGVDLNPSGFDITTAYGTTDTSQVGYGKGAATVGALHALLWSGTATSKVDLNPTGYSNSIADGIAGTYQVGYAEKTGASDYHAIVWHSSAISAVDLNPTGFTESEAKGTTTTNQVGWANSSSHHAMLWAGTAASAIDLNPTGFTSSEALAISTKGEVGVGNGPATGFSDHAFYWNGTAASAIDLQPLLSSLGKAFTSSKATGISDNGTIVGTAFVGGTPYAVEWNLIVESGVPGDYNNNGVVDMADYIVWRTGGHLANEISTLGTDTADDYTAWRANFGNKTASGSGASTGAAVPEPAFPILLISLALSALGARSPRRRHLSV